MEQTPSTDTDLRKPKGHVEFHEPPSIVAEMPDDEEMRDHLDEMKRNDGYEGSCGL
ncbi:hypothetical protein [Paenibacillus swuensis]|uniref:hypothetical protein n=1 Tax=Paenibacillus swuensis TaxID=1178515 RepID=UPI000A7F13F0|nr:hypothetical protein [Paenibacillus swuensis]